MRCALLGLCVGECKVGSVWMMQVCMEYECFGVCVRVCVCVCVCICL